MSLSSLTAGFKFITLFCILSCALTVMSCTRGKKNDSSTLKIALSSSPATLDPRRATDATGMRICNLIFQSLVRIGPNLDVEGDAASKWSFKNNTYRFELKPGLKFQNGRAITAKDIEFSFTEFKSPKSPFSSAFAPIQSVVVKTENSDATDPATNKLIVEVKVDQYSAKFLTSDLPVLKILPAQEIATQGEAFNEIPFGSGPLRIKEFTTEHILLERVEALPADSKLYTAFEFKVIKDDFTRSQKLIKGELDVAIAELPPDIVHRLQKKERDRLQIYTYPGLSMTYILVNLKDPVLARKEVRQGISQAIHREEMIKYKLLGLGQEATSILTPNNPYFNPELKNAAFDLATAKEKLKDVSGLSLKTSSNPTAVDHGKVIAYQLEKAGPKVNLQSFEWGTFYNDIKTGNFQLATMKWVGAFDPDIYRIAFHSSELPPGRNRGAYVNKDLDVKLEQAFRIENFEKRKKTYQEIQKVIFEDIAIIPLWYETQAAVLRKDLKNFQTSPLSDYYGLLQVSVQEN